MKHNWKTKVWEPGNKKQICKVCGAVRTNHNISVKQNIVWSPATLNGKRQPFCPGR